MQQALWLARMALLSAGGALTARGIGDETLWQAVTGALLTIATAVWSRIERRRLAAAPAVPQ